MLSLLLLWIWLKGRPTLYRFTAVSRWVVLAGWWRQREGGEGGKRKEKKQDLCCGLSCYFMDSNIITVLIVVANWMCETNCRLVVINTLHQPIESLQIGRLQAAGGEKSNTPYPKKAVLQGEKCWTKSCLHMESTVVSVKTKCRKKQHMQPSLQPHPYTPSLLQMSVYCKSFSQWTRWRESYCKTRTDVSLESGCVCLPVRVWDWESERHIGS